MVNKSLTLIIVSFLFSASVHSHPFDFQLRASLYIPQDSTIREVYDDGWNDWQIEGNLGCCGSFTTWVNFAYSDKDGHSTCLNDKTTLKSFSLTTGLKQYFCPINCLRPYIGLGIGVDYKRFTDHSAFVDHHLHKWCPTVIFKSGIEKEMMCNYFINFFFDYSYTYLRGNGCNEGIEQRSFDAGGYFVGIGIGKHL